VHGAPRQPVARPVPGDVVTASAPVRICDIGGWTDTWFAGRGKVFNIAVEPRVEVRARVLALDSVAPRVTLDVANFGDRYGYGPGPAPGRHPLLEAIVDDASIPDGVGLEVRVASAVPAGCSTGTSAAVAVALIGALDALSGRPRSLDEVARSAHRIEVERLGLESGVQDQLCAAHGALNFIEIDPYPDATRTPVVTRRDVWRRLQQRLLLVYLGRAHASSAVDELRACAVAARDALRSGDLEGLGRAMRRNTDAQRRLHGGLVSAQAEAIIDVAASRGASGWKVNGAGGEGGSLSILCGPDPERCRAMEREVLAVDPAFEVIPIRLSRAGLRLARAEAAFTPPGVAS
jgi:D-glycero-alpha-D-manno-heptose-7-phosphate kinase